MASFIAIAAAYRRRALLRAVSVKHYVLCRKIFAALSRHRGRR